MNDRKIAVVCNAAMEQNNKYFSAINFFVIMNYR